MWNFTGVRSCGVSTEVSGFYHSGRLLDIVVRAVIMKMVNVAVQSA
jgi:hypothetical protein